MMIIRSDPGSWDIDELHRHTRKYYEWDWHEHVWYKRVFVARRERSNSRGRTVPVFVRRH